MAKGAKKGNAERELELIINNTGQDIGNLSMSIPRPRLKEAFTLRFRDRLTYGQVGVNFGVTRERARQMVEMGIKYLNLSYRL